jgi:hypothetical protein
MTKQQFWKGLFMLLIGIIMTSFGQTPINYVLMAITAVAAILPYVGKNLIVFFTSTTPAGKFSWLNALSGLLIALGTGLTDYIGQYLFVDVINWAVLWHVVIGVTLMYVSSTYFAPPNSQSPKLL